MSDPKHQTKRALSSLGWWLVAVVFIAAATIDALGIFGRARSMAFRIGIVQLA
jgi:hypothetical protein